MDPLSGTASVIAVVTAALQTGIAIHKAVSGIRDAPQQVSRLASTFDDLNSLLHQLADILTCSPDEQSGDLSKLVDRCVADINAFKGKLAKLNAAPGERPLSRTWKRVKKFIHQDEFGGMGLVVRDHITSLKFQLDVLQRWFNSIPPQYIYY